MISELIQLGLFSWVQEVWYDWSDGRNAYLRIDVDSNSYYVDDSTRTKVVYGSQCDLSNAQSILNKGEVILINNKYFYYHS